MSGTVTIVLVAVIGIGGLVGVAWLLDRRRRVAGSIGPVLPPPGPSGRLFLWIARGLVAAMVLSILGAFVFRSLTLAWVTATCLLLYIIDGLMYRAVRITRR